MAAAYNIVYDPDVLKFLESLDAKVRRQIIPKIDALSSEPFPKGRYALLKGRTESGNQVYRIRHGKYRILYMVEGQAIVILDIDHRKDVYR